jgi:hypothetical protein
MSTLSNVAEYYGYLYNLPDRRFFFASTSATTSVAGQSVSIITMTAFPTLSTVEDQDDIAEGLEGLAEPTVATWADVRAKLGL